MRDEKGYCPDCGSGPSEMHAQDCIGRETPPHVFGPGVNLPLSTGFIAVPGGSPTPATPGAAYGPLTADEREQVAYLRTALSGLDETLSLEPMRVVHDGYPRVALVAVKHAGDEVLATPLALLIDPALFEAMGTPQPEMKGPVQKDDEPGD